MEKKIYSLISFILWFALAICWAGLIFLDFKRGDASAGQIAIHALFLMAASIISFKSYSEYKSYKK